MIILELIVLLILLYIIYILSYSMLMGAPFATLSKSRINTMMDLLKPVKNKKFLDLGSGDGRIVIAASKKGIKAFGYEINPLLILISKANLIKSNSSGKILLKDYWKSDLSEFDYISIWGLPHMMGRLEKKLLLELKNGSKVVSNHYKFPSWKHEEKKNDVYLYVKR